MTAAPELNPEAAATSIPTDTASIPLPTADVPLRRPNLDGRAVRTTVLWEVRTRLVLDGQVETWLYRREPAACKHAARLRAQGYPVRVARATVVGWSVVSR